MTVMGSSGSDTGGIVGSGQRGLWKGPPRPPPDGRPNALSVSLERSRAEGPPFMRGLPQEQGSMGIVQGISAEGGRGVASWDRAGKKAVGTMLSQCAASQRKSIVRIRRAYSFDSSKGAFGTLVHVGFACRRVLRTQILHARSNTLNHGLQDQTIDEMNEK